MFFTSILIFVISVFIIIWYKREKKLPPGPYGLPIVGYYPFIHSDPFVKITKISENYGSIMRMNLLGADFYFLNDLEAVREAFKNQSEIFSGRSTNEFNLVNKVHGLKGLQNSEGDDWKVQKKFYLNKLSGLGMGKSDFSIRIHDLCDQLINYIKNKEEIENLQSYLSNFTSNVIQLLLTNTTFALTDPYHIEFTETFRRLSSCGTGFRLFLSGPLAYIFIRLNHKLWTTFMRERNHLFEMVSKLIHDRVEKPKTNECEDIMDYCLQQMNGPYSDLFNHSNLVVNIVLLFGAGTETTASTLNLGINLMATHKNVQKKVYNEIVDTFGKEYKVLPRDIEKLNYTRAVIDEIQRYACILPFGLIHCNREATNICGYHIPKRSRIIANIWKISRDKRYFKHPEAFDPDNFLDDHEKYKPNEALIPFGIGKRKCLGKKLAEMELIIAFTRLIQQFEWLPPKNEVMSYKIKESAVRHLSQFKIIAKLRSD